MSKGKYIRTPEILKKMSSSHKGKPSHRLGAKHTEEAKRKVGDANRGRKKSLETIEKWKISNKGRKHTIEARMKIGVKGEKHWNWQGGITPINSQIRNSLEYKLWREAVFKRDNFICVWCGEKGGELNADHIKSFSLFPELRFAIDNGRTLCYSCHTKTDNYAGKYNKKI